MKNIVEISQDVTTSSLTMPLCLKLRSGAMGGGGIQLPPKSGPSNRKDGAGSYQFPLLPTTLRPLEQERFSQWIRNISLTFLVGKQFNMKQNASENLYKKVLTWNSTA